MKKLNKATPALLLALLLTACGTPGNTNSSAPAETTVLAESSADTTGAAESDTPTEEVPAVQIGEPEKTKLELGHLNSTAHLLAFVAAEEGYFAEEGLNVTLINARFVKPFDKKLIKNLSEDHSLLVTMEENVLTGGFGEHVCRYVEESEVDIKVLPIALPDAYIEHGSVKILFEESGIDPESVKNRVISEYNNLSK